MGQSLYFKQLSESGQKNSHNSNSNYNPSSPNAKENIARQLIQSSEKKHQNQQQFKSSAPQQLLQQQSFGFNKTMVQPLESDLVNVYGKMTVQQNPEQSSPNFSKRNKESQLFFPSGLNTTTNVNVSQLVERSIKGQCKEKAHTPTNVRSTIVANSHVWQKGSISGQKLGSAVLSETNSTAISKAMKALQDKVKQMEGQLKEEQSSAEQRIQLLSSQNEILQSELTQMGNQKSMMELKLFNAQDKSQELFSRNERLNMECMSKADEANRALQEQQILQRQYEIAETEKLRHLDLNQYEKHQLEQQLGNQIQQNEQLIKVIAELESSLQNEEAVKMNLQEQLNQCISSNDMLIKHRQNNETQLDQTCKLQEQQLLMAQSEKQQLRAYYEEQSVQQRLETDKLQAQITNQTQKGIDQEQLIHEYEQQNIKLSADIQACKAQIKALLQIKQNKENDRLVINDSYQQMMFLHNELITCVKQEKQLSTNFAIKSIIAKSTRLQNQMKRLHNDQALTLFSEQQQFQDLNDVSEGNAILSKNNTKRSSSLSKQAKSHQQTKMKSAAVTINHNHNRIKGRKRSMSQTQRSQKSQHSHSSQNDSSSFQLQSNNSSMQQQQYMKYRKIKTQQNPRKRLLPLVSSSTRSQSQKSRGSVSGRQKQYQKQQIQKQNAHQVDNECFQNLISNQNDDEKNANFNNNNTLNVNLQENFQQGLALANPSFGNLMLNNNSKYTLQTAYDKLEKQQFSQQFNQQKSGINNNNTNSSGRLVGTGTVQIHQYTNNSDFNQENDQQQRASFNCASGAQLFNHNLKLERPMPSPRDNISKITEQEISNDILKQERIISELKCQYQQLQTQQNDCNQYPSSNQFANKSQLQKDQSSNRLQELTREIDQRTEYYILLKQKQRESIQRSLRQLHQN